LLNILSGNKGEAGMGSESAVQRRRVTLTKRVQGEADPETDVGARLRLVRARLDLSQRALARSAGVPSSSISLIENGKVNPSVGVLKRLLDAAGLSLGEFFSFDLPPDDALFFPHAELAEISKGDVSYRQVGSDLGRRRLQILHETYQPGGDSGRVPLSHDGEEGGIVIEGRLEVTVGDRRRVLGPGDAYLFDSTTPHRFRNVGRTACVVISACTPPSF